MHRAVLLVSCGLLLTACNTRVGTALGLGNSCEPEDARVVGACQAFVKPYWDGTFCRYESGCSCEGSDCYRYDTVEECNRAHAHCPTAPRMCGRNKIWCDAIDLCGIAPDGLGVCVPLERQSRSCAALQPFVKSCEDEERRLTAKLLGSFPCGAPDRHCAQGLQECHLFAWGTSPRGMGSEDPFSYARCVDSRREAPLVSESPPPRSLGNGAVYRFSRAKPGRGLEDPGWLEASPHFDCGRDAKPCERWKEICVVPRNLGPGGRCVPAPADEPDCITRGFAGCIDDGFGARYRLEDQQTGNCLFGPEKGNICTRSEGCRSFCSGGPDYDRFCAHDNDCRNYCASGPRQGAACTRHEDCGKSCEVGRAGYKPCTTDAECPGSPCRVWPVCSSPYCQEAPCY